MHLNDSTSFDSDLVQLLSSSSATSPHGLFCSIGDDFWLWLNTTGYRTNERLRHLLPGLPSEYFQLAVASRTGDETLREAFSIYKLFRHLIEKHYKSVSDCEAVLDFGCGWGRLTRFFLRDIDGSQLWGIDQWRELIDAGKEIDRWCQYVHVSQKPPTEFSDNQFDVIFSYSVFSHLPEGDHKLWIDEFRRILKPGGLLIATTWGREQILFLETVSKQESTSWDDHYNRAVATRFPGLEKALRLYDGGDFFHIDLGYPTYPGYGDACIPRQYVAKEWGSSFEILDYIEERSLCSQNVIVARKPR